MQDSTNHSYISAIFRSTPSQTRRSIETLGAFIVGRTLSRYGLVKPVQALGMSSLRSEISPCLENLNCLEVMGINDYLKYNVYSVHYTF